MGNEDGANVCSNCELRLQGNEYDPFLEYSVSVIAQHVERDDHLHPNGPDFTARVFTGTYVKMSEDKSIETQIQPDACCGGLQYNTGVRVCCGGTLYDKEKHECCGTSFYDKHSFMCCKADDGFGNPDIKTLSTGCGFGQVLVGSGKSFTRRGRG